MLRGLRILTIEISADYRLTEILSNNEELVPKLISLLQPGLLGFKEKSECLWILSNLACDSGVCYKMLTQWNIYSVIFNLFNEHFISPSDAKPAPLS